MCDFQLLTSSSVDGPRGPSVKVTGRTLAGESLLLSFDGFLPRFYLRLTDALERQLPELLKLLTSHLNYAERRSGARWSLKRDDDPERHVAAKGVVHKLDFCAGYCETPARYALLEFASMAAHRVARDALTNPLGRGPEGRRAFPYGAALLKRLFPQAEERITAVYDGKGKGVVRKDVTFVLAEANVDFHSDLLERAGVSPGGWATVDALPRSVEEGRRVYVLTGLDKVRRLEASRASPVRVLAWDLEVWCHPLDEDGAMKFYDGDEEGARLLCVSAVTFEYGVAGSERSRVFSVGDGPPAEGVVWCGDDDADVVKAFVAYVRAYDADVLTGWNTLGFDWPWHVKRCAALRLNLDGLARWGKLAVDDTGRGQPFSLPGRIVHDSLEHTKQSVSLREYRLDDVCAHFKMEGKDDVKYSEIAGLSATHAGRVKLADYCAVDSLRVVQIFRDKLDFLGKLLAFAELTGTPPEELLYKKSLHKLRNAMLRASHADGYLLPYPPEAEKSADKFTGGKNLEPKEGFYPDPTVVLDFRGLYPAIMMMDNVCASTRTTRARARAEGWPYLQPPAPSLSGLWYDAAGVRVARVEERADDDVRVDGKPFAYTSQLNDALTNGASLADGGYELRFADGTTWRRKDEEVLVYVHPSLRRGVVPKLERTLFDTRNAVKAELKKAKAELKKAQQAGDADAVAVASLRVAFLDNNQNAVKLVQNAMYGLLGASRGIYPDSAAMARGITARGRELLCDVVRKLTTRFWLTADGVMGVDDAPTGAKPLEVLYGDTDSVMVYFPGCNLQQAARHGEAISKWFSANVLQDPQELQFEKVLQPSAFFKKKKYAAIMHSEYSATGEYGAKKEFFAKGLSVVRRDNAKCVAASTRGLLERMFAPGGGGDREALVAFCAQTLADAYVDASHVHEEGRSLDRFVASGSVGDKPRVTPAQVVARQMLAANPQCGVNKGDRVSYVYVERQRPEDGRAEQALLPSLCRRAKTPLDAQYYVDALTANLTPLLCVFFAEEERKKLGIVRDVHGRAVARNSDVPVGQATAKKALLAAFEKLPQVVEEKRRRGRVVERGQRTLDGGGVVRAQPVPAQKVVAKRKKEEEVPKGQRLITGFVRK
jgi:DNA polymerase elongation subunit (family B)